jgi:ABC-2 type transport system ATP-binding protein
VERLVSHVGIIAKGRMVFQGTLPELQNLQKAEGNLQLQTSDNGAARQLLKAYRTETVADGLTVAISGPEEIASLNRLLVQHGIDVYRLQPHTSNLEQLFINLTNSPS